MFGHLIGWLFEFSVTAAYLRGHPNTIKSFSCTTYMPFDKIEVRGRPKRTYVQKLRDYIWINALELQSGLTTGYSLQQAIEPHTMKKESGVIHRPRKWDNYVNGTQGPGKVKGKADSIELAEKCFPGSSKCFKNPIWRILDGVEFSQLECESSLRELGEAVCDVLFEEFNGNQNQKILAPFTEHSSEWIVRLGSLDALAAIVILAQYAECIGSSDLKNKIFLCYKGLQKTVPSTPELEPFYWELFELIDHRFHHWSFITNTQRMSTMIHWEGRAKYLKDNNIELLNSLGEDLIERTRREIDDDSIGGD